ncbi:MAG TPA: hypothetical protein VJ964_10685, partial [Balneolaceae bacterium]|nr:hypothetical protein [Balneolaceae bacterium]
MIEEEKKHKARLDFHSKWEYSPAPESSDHIQLKEQYELFINGAFVAPEQGEYFDTINPAKEEKLSSVALATEADIDK